MRRYAEIENSASLPKQRLNPFDVGKLIFSRNNKLEAKWDAIDRLDDKNLAPLFVHCNYLAVTDDSFDTYANISDALSMGDHMMHNHYEGYDIPEYGHMVSGAVLGVNFKGKIEFPSQFFERRTERNKAQMIVDAMKGTITGNRYSRGEGLVMDVYQYIVSKDNVAALSQNSVLAANFTSTISTFGLDVFRDKVTTELVVKKIHAESGIRRATAPTFKAGDEDKIDAAVVATLLTPRAVEDVQPTKKRKIDSPPPPPHNNEQTESGVAVVVNDEDKQPKKKKKKVQLDVPLTRFFLNKTK
jgi:hypothetical protein